MAGRQSVLFPCEALYHIREKNHLKKLFFVNLIPLQEWMWHNCEFYVCQGWNTHCLNLRKNTQKKKKRKKRCSCYQWLHQYFFVGALRGQNAFLRGKNPKIIDFLHFFFKWGGGKWGRASNWGSCPLMPPHWCHHWSQRMYCRDTSCHHLHSQGGIKLTKKTKGNTNWRDFKYGHSPGLMLLSD